MEECSWLETILKQNQTKQSISRVIKVKVEKLCSDGDFYSSDISNIILDVILTDGRKKKISLIQKKAKSAKHDNLFEGFPNIKREIMVYENVLQKFDQLMSEYQDNSDKLWGNLIGYKPYSLIVFENLKAQNFKIANRRVLLDINHTLLVVNSLGKFHALGHVLIKKGLLSKDDFSQHYIEKDSPIVEKIFKNGIKQISEEIEKQWPSEWKEIAVRLGKEHSVILEKLKKLFITSKDTFMTFCHGDCWTCNLLFKYCPYDETLPTAVKFIDFQTGYINSYITDIMHFLHVCVQPEIRRTYFDKILSTYQKSLQLSLTFYGMEDSAPTLEHVHAEAARIEYYAFALNMLFLPLTCSEVTNAFVLDNIFSEWTSNKVFNSELYSSDTSKELLGNEIKYWQKRGIF